MYPVHATLFISIIVCVIPCVFTVGPVMSSWAQKHEELPTLRQGTNEFMR